MKAQLLGRIQRYRIFLQQGIPVPDIDGEEIQIINFDFEDQANIYINENQMEGDSEEIQTFKTQLKSGDALINEIKLTDQDLEGLIVDLGKRKQFKGELWFGGNNLTDQTLIRIANLLKEGLQIQALSLRDSRKFTFIGGQEIGKTLKQSNSVKRINFHNCTLGDLGVNQIIECVGENENIQEYDLGMITDNSLRYLGKYLGQPHNIKDLCFQEDTSQGWQEETKEFVLEQIRYNQHSNKFLSISAIDIENKQKHANFIGQLEILSSQNRQAYLQERSNDFKAKELDTEHPEYYHPDDFKENAFKFSVKTYLSNVFESLLDESLYYLEKERSNVLRDEQIQKVTNEFQQKTILEDICTADGSIMVLARYLLTKTKK